MRRLNKWYFIFCLRLDYELTDTKIFQLGVFKFTSIPPMGEITQKNHYKGFWIIKRWKVKGFDFNNFYNFYK